MPISYRKHSHLNFSLYIALGYEDGTYFSLDKVGIIVAGEDVHLELTYDLGYKPNISASIHIHAVIFGIAIIRRHLGAIDPSLIHLRVHSRCPILATLSPSVTYFEYDNLSKFAFDTFLHIQSQLGGIDFFLASEEDAVFKQAQEVSFAEPSKDCWDVYYPNLAFMNMTTIDGVSVYASNSFATSKPNQNAMIDASFLWSRGSSGFEATERLKPSFSRAVVHYIMSQSRMVFGCVDLDISVDICGAMKTVRLTDVLVVEDLPVPLHLPSWVFDGESIRIDLCNTTLSSIRFPEEYHQNMFWSTLATETAKYYNVEI